MDDLEIHSIVSIAQIRKVSEVCLCDINDRAHVYRVLIPCWNILFVVLPLGGTGKKRPSSFRETSGGQQEMTDKTS